MGGGIGMGNRCKPMAVSFQFMTKSTTIKKKRKKEKKKQMRIQQPLILLVFYIIIFFGLFSRLSLIIFLQFDYDMPKKILYIFIYLKRFQFSPLQSGLLVFYPTLKCFHL